MEALAPSAGVLVRDPVKKNCYESLEPSCSSYLLQYLRVAYSR